MIILIGGFKGGSGKSTSAVCLASSLASENYDVLLVDGNATQGTASNWMARREDLNRELPVMTCVEKSGKLTGFLQTVRDRYDIIIVDTAGYNSVELRSSILVADLLVTPVRVSQPDIETLVQMSEMVEEASIMNPNLDARILLTNASTHPHDKETNEVKELAVDIENMALMSTIVYHRKVYSNAIAKGLSPLEMPKNKAQDELKALTSEIINYAS